MSIPKKLQKALDKAVSAADKFAAYEDIAEHFYNNQDFKRCLPHYEKVLQAAEALNSEGKIAKAHRMIGEALSWLGEYKESLKHQKLFYEYGKAGESSRLDITQRALTTLGRTYLMYGNSLEKEHPEKAQQLYSKAQDHLRHSLLVAKNLEDKCLLKKSEISEMNAVSLMNQGVVFENQKNVKEAFDKYNQALRVCRANDLPQQQIKCCVNLAALHARSGNFSDTYRLFKEAKGKLQALTEYERKNAELEILLAEEEAYFHHGDISSARKILQKAYRLMPSVERESVERSLRIDVAMDIAIRKLHSSSQLSPEEEVKLYELLGDGYSERKAYKHALVHYKKMLECCKKAGCNPKPCYVSLAQTAKDLNMYKESITYFEEEIAIDIRNNKPKSACQSLLVIEECQMHLGVSVKVRLNSIKRAWDLVQKTDHSKLKVQVLSKLKILQNEFGDPELEKTELALQNLRKDLDSVDSDSENDESVKGTQEIGEDINLDDISDCESENDEEEFEVLANNSEVNRSKRSNSRRSVANWKNEKGETKLHLACIRGDIKSVKCLIEQGCDINATDNGGWTPLHEACNFGHEEIVELLLNHGANVNAKSSDGVTPLYDAALNGNLEVVDTLLRNNALVLVLTSEDNSPVDALKDYQRRMEGNFSPEEEESCSKMIDKLQAVLDRLGYTPKDKKKEYKESSTVNKHNSNLRRGLDVYDCPSESRVMREISPVCNSSSSEYSPIKIRTENDEAHQEVKEYQKAMKRVRKNCAEFEEISVEPKTPIPSLITENEIVDDWLEDDLKNYPSKRRKTLDPPKMPLNNYKPLSLTRKNSHRQNLSSRPSSRASSCGSRNSMGSHDDVRLSVGSRGKSSPEMDPVLPVDDSMDFSIFEDGFMPASPNRSNPVDEFSLHSPHIGQNHHQPALPSYSIARKENSPILAACQPMHQLSSQVINVRIEDTVLAIPVADQTLTIRGLREEASKRLYEIKGISCKLEIQTAEGAFISDDDLVSYFVGGNNLIGIVKDVAALTDRYRDACKFFKVEVCNDVQRALQQSEASEAITIINCAFPFSVLKPVFKAISMEHSLSRINFSNNWIGDEGLANFCDLISRLINLKELDLSCNGLTAQGIRSLANTTKKGNLQGLIELNLSFNDLRDLCIQPLSELTASLPTLRSLSLADCQLSKHLWDGNNYMLTLSNLRALEISGNLLEASGVAGWLGYHDHDQSRRLNANILETLRLVGVGGSKVCQEVELFLDNAQVIALKELSISYAEMQDDDLSQLLRALKSAPKFRHIFVPATPCVSGKLICEILHRQPPFNSVDIKSINESWQGINSEELTAAATAAAKGIERLTLKGAPHIFEETWKNVKGMSGVMKRGAFGTQIFMTVLD